MQAKNARIHRLMAVGVALVMGLAISDMAQASLVTFKFAGTLGLGGTNHVPITGSYAFDSTTPDISPGVADRGNYAFNTLSFRIMGNDYRGSKVAGSVALNVLDTDRYGVVAATISGSSLSGPLFGGAVPTNVSLSVIGTDLFTSDALPLTPPSLGGSGTTTKVVLSLRSRVVDGPLTSLTLAPVPLPGALLLFGSGLLGMAGLLARRCMRKPMIG